MGARLPNERGSALLIALIALTGLLSLAALTAMSVQGGMASTSTKEFDAIALYAAESGAAAGMDYLRKNIVFTAGAGAWPPSFVSASNASPPQPADLPGNNKPPGDPGNLLDAGLGAWYTVELLNDRADPGYAAGADENGDLVLRVTGHGPDGATAQIEVELNGAGLRSAITPCPSYGQKDLAENGAGANDCLGNVTGGGVTTFHPGGS